MSIDILICDGLNLFLRHYCANPSMTGNGEACGGTVGMFKAIATLAGVLNPKKIIVCWEGGGSARRRKIYPEYKAHRKPVKLNRFYDNDIPDSAENQDQQLKWLTQLLSYLPVTQIYVPNCEADDVIGYLCKYIYRDETKVIVSSDKDFYQLVNDNTTIYRPTKKVYIKPEHVMEEYGIDPKNFSICKAIVGDKSDNIPGIKSVGFKTLIKRIPQLGNPEQLTLKDIYLFCAAEAVESKVKAYDLILENREVISRNYKLMHLDIDMLSASQMKQIRGIVDVERKTMNKLEVLRWFTDQGIATDAMYLLYPFKSLLI